MPLNGKILLVDDDDLVLKSLKQLFMDDYDVALASSGLEALDVLGAEADIDAIVLDIRMARLDGLQTAGRIRKSSPDIPIIFYTGYPGDYAESDIEKNHQPFDYVTKNERPSRLIRTVKNAVRFHRAKDGSKDLVDHARAEYGIIGKSKPMQAVYRTLAQIADSDNKVIILGPTGSGKELVARALFKGGRRAQKRFAILNCNHKQPDLVESELFGHKRGSFTGAVEDRTGLFEYADGGTLFLDEVGDLDITTQAKLLRVLETGEMQKIGAPEIKKVDVRIICATHRDLPSLVTEGQFREDLYYRLKGITVTLPALRDRREDIPDLIDYFVDTHCRNRGDGIRCFEPAAIDVMIGYDWPGNVRQLADTVYSLIDLSASSYITCDEVTGYLQYTPDSGSGNGGMNDQVREFKKTLIIKALHRHQNNVSAAARDLSMDPANLHRMLKSLQIELV